MVTTSPSTFAAQLRRHRLAAGLTQEALAELAGLSARGVQDLERGIRTAPRAETVRLLADALGLDTAARAALIAAARPELGAPVPVHQRLVVLPIPATPLVGREREVAEACAQLRGRQVRLLTLTGPGGIGKTRLALEIATALASDFGDGVVWVDLAPLRDATLVASAIARVLDVHESGEQPLPALLTRTLAERHLLLVLDNCEHLLPAMTLIGELLAASPQLRVLATSRARLRLRGERELPVPPLPVPTATNPSAALAELPEAASVRLFVERAQAVRPEFALTAANAAQVIEICRRLDGLPLAIELAAARVKVLPPAALLARLERRLLLLASGAHDAPARQRTMRDAIAWSYELLSASEQVVFQRLAVFAGGCTLDAAEVVTTAGAGPPDELGIVLEKLAALVDQSLLRVDEQTEPGVAGEARFAMLETVREYALECLEASGEAEAIRHAHAAFYVALAEQAEAKLTGPQQTQWLTRLEVEHDNVRAALGWAIAAQSSTAIGVRLAGALWRFWWMRGHYREGRSWLEQALEAGAGTAPERAKALYGAGSIATEQGDYEQAMKLLEAALATARSVGERDVAALALTDMGSIARQQGAYERAAHFHREALDLRRESGDRRGIAVSLGNLGLAALYQGEYARAEELLTEAAAAFRDLGDRHSLITTISNLAHAAAFHGDFARARALVAESLAGYREMADHQGMADDLVTLGLATQGEGDLTRAIALFGEALTHAREIGYRLGEAAALHRLGLAFLETADSRQALTLLGESLRIVRATGDFEEMTGILDGVARAAVVLSPEGAARFLGMAEALRETSGTSRPPAEHAPHERAMAATQQALGESAFAAAAAAGRALPLEQTIAEVLAFTDEKREPDTAA